MASLRVRLVVALLALSSVGLLLLGAITYANQRSFQLDRLDEQVRAAPGPVARALADRGVGPKFPSRPERRAAPGPGGEPRPGFNLPPGTYGQRRDASGKVLGHVVLSYGENVTANPRLPAKIQPGRPFTVNGGRGDTTRYRVLAVPDPSGSGLTVAAVPLRGVDSNLDHLLLVEALVIAGVLLILGLLSWVVVRIGLLPLDRMAHTAGAIAGGDLSRRVDTVDERTEVGRLGSALNSMLDRLDRAFAEKTASEERLRRFIADASHELRTPLASIRGYAELFRIGAARDAEGTEKAMSRIEAEAARMGVLVEDLLTLARLDEVRDLPHGEVDLGALARDAVDDARASAAGREVALSVDGPAAVVGDENQLRQVLANLLRNAVAHTPEGTAIEVALRSNGAYVLASVRDHGPGLPTADGSELFERFWRAEGGRERGRGGAGLGLAIVAAIVGAHRGSVEASNAPGGGARFSVSLPAAAPAGR
jgi:two-component system OmpR family sensor kinase